MDLECSHELQTLKPTKELFDGAKLGLPICVGYLPIALTFGLLAKNSGLPMLGGTLMSALVYAGASQFVAVNMLALNMGSLQIILTTFILNFRCFLMSASLASKIKTDNKAWGWILGFGITDETFAVATLSKRKTLSPYFMLGLSFSVYPAWVFGTLLGFIVASSLPTVIQSSMNIALYAMFIGLLIPSVRKSLSAGLVALLGALFNILFALILPAGWALVMAAVVGAIFATFLIKEV